MRAWLLTVVVAFAGIVAAPVAKAETLADALIAAYKNSNLLEQNRAVLRAADEDVALAVSSLRPVVAYTAQAGWQRAETDGFFGPTVNEGLAASLTLTAEMTLIDFGRNRLSIEIARESVLATRQALIDVEQNVLLTAVRAYVDVRLAQEVVALRQSNLRLIAQELRAARDRFEVGEITKTDVSIAEARLAASRAALASAEGRSDDRARRLTRPRRGRTPATLRPCPEGSGSAPEHGRGAGCGAGDPSADPPGQAPGDRYRSAGRTGQGEPAADDQWRCATAADQLKTTS